MSDSLLQKRIMRRVYFIWGVRQLAQPFVLRLALFAALVWQVKEVVFVRQVFANMANYEAGELFNFWSAAFMNTDFMVQVATLGVGVLSILFVRDIIAARDEKGMVFAKSM